MLNKVFLIGRLGNDPDGFDGGCRLRLAIDSGNKVNWVRVLVFNSESETCLKHKKKGDRILIEGRLEESKNNELIVISNRITFL